MSNTIQLLIASARRHYARLGLVLTGLVLTCTSAVHHSALTDRWARIRASGDRGSESVEKAVLVAIGLAVAIGLGFAIRALVVQFQDQLKAPTQP